MKKAQIIKMRLSGVRERFATLGGGEGIIGFLASVSEYAETSWVFMNAETGALWIDPQAKKMEKVVESIQ